MATIQNVNKQELNATSLAIAGVDLPAGATVIRLHAFVSGATYSVMRTAAEVAYQVPASKVLDIYEIDGQDNGTSASVRVLYGTTSSGVSGAAPTSPIYYGTGTSSAVDCFVTSNARPKRPIFFQVPATMFPTIQNATGGANCWFSLLAIERAV